MQFFFREGRFETGLFYAREGHVSPHHALPFLLKAAEDAGAEIMLGVDKVPGSPDAIVDCRGLAARDALKDLRGVRGERPSQSDRGRSDQPVQPCSSAPSDVGEQHRGIASLLVSGFQFLVSCFSLTAMTSDGSSFA